LRFSSSSVVVMVSGIGGTPLGRIVFKDPPVQQTTFQRPVPHV
jgi:hypothetical protein